MEQTQKDNLKTKFAQAIRKKPIFKERALIKSMTANLFIKPVSMLLGYLYTPFLLAYLGTEQYGIWATILSIISWITCFDIGIGNGLRNVLTASLGKKDYRGSQAAVTTAYRILSMILAVAMGVVLTVFAFLNWRAIFHTEINAKLPILISVLFMGINILFSLYQAQCYALQKAEWVSYNGVIVQLINLGGVILLNRIAGQNRLINMAFLFSLSTFITNIAFTAYIWSKHDYLRPRIGAYDPSQKKSIVNVGLHFMFLQLAVLMLAATDNFIISALFGAEAVTPYATANKLFILFYTAFSAISNPLWSRCTVAFVQKNFSWIRKMIASMNLLLIPTGIVMAVVVVFFQPISDFWLHKTLFYEPMLIITMALSVFMSIYTIIYSTVMNSTGKLIPQIIVTSASAVLHIPLGIYFARNLGMGTTGICLAGLSTAVVSNIIYTIYVKKLISREENLAANDPAASVNPREP